MALDTRGPQTSPGSDNGKRPQVLRRPEIVRRPDVALGDVFTALVGDQAPLRFSAYDGSQAGDPNAAMGIRLTAPRGASYLATAPGSLGLARAYVKGDLEIDGVHPGDPYELLRVLDDDLEVRRPSAGQILHWVRGLGLRALVPPEPPAQEVRHPLTRHGLRHSKSRDAEAIHHHYDVSNAFYQYVLGPSMAYTCACYPEDDATLEQAQEHKFDLVARKLALAPGMRLLDVGCGWGSMVIHAAKHYGVQALGVTLSAEQAAFAQQRIKDEGLEDLAEVRHLRLPGRPGARVRRRQLDRPDRAHRGQELRRLLRLPAARGCVPVAGC